MLILSIAFIGKTEFSVWRIYCKGLNTMSLYKAALQIGCVLKWKNYFWIRQKIVFFLWIHFVYFLPTISDFQKFSTFHPALLCLWMQILHSAYIHSNVTFVVNSISQMPTATTLLCLSSWKYSYKFIYEFKPLRVS